MSIGDGKDSPDHEKVGLTGIYVQKKNAALARILVLSVATFLFYTVESLPQLAFLRQRICEFNTRTDFQARPDRPSAP
jgi:hypothetical protein